MSLRRERPSKKRRRVVTMPAWVFWVYLISFGFATSFTSLWIWVEVIGNG